MVEWSGITQFSVTTKRMICVAFSHDGTRIAFASGDTAARVWDVFNCRKLAQFN